MSNLKNLFKLKNTKTQKHKNTKSSHKKLNLFFIYKHFIFIADIMYTDILDYYSHFVNLFIIIIMFSIIFIIFTSLYTTSINYHILFGNPTFINHMLNKHILEYNFSSFYFWVFYNELSCFISLVFLSIIQNNYFNLSNNSILIIISICMFSVFIQLLIYSTFSLQYQIQYNYPNYNIYYIGTILKSNMLVYWLYTYLDHFINMYTDFKIKK